MILIDDEASRRELWLYARHSMTANAAIAMNAQRLWVRIQIRRPKNNWTINPIIPCDCVSFKINHEQPKNADGCQRACGKAASTSVA